MCRRIFAEGPAEPAHLQQGQSRRHADPYLAITSDTLPLEKVNDFADTLLAQKLSEVSGVGLVTIEGIRNPPCASR